MSEKPSYVNEARQAALFEDSASNGPKAFAQCDGSLREAISAAIRRCRRGDRAWLAAELTRLLDVDVTRGMIDSWSAPSRENHRIPASYLPALCIALGDMQPLRLLVELTGCQLSEPDEIGLIAWARAEVSSARARAHADRLRPRLVDYMQKEGRR